MKNRSAVLQPFHIDRRTGAGKGLCMVKKGHRTAESRAAREKTTSSGIRLRSKYEARAPTAHLRRCGTYDLHMPLMKFIGFRRRRWWQNMRYPAFAYRD